MRKKVVFLLFLVIVCTSYTGNKEIRRTSGSIISREAIDAVLRITSDNDFLALGMNGTGTKNDPFIIEELNIKSQEKGGICISNTTKYCIINNCTFETLQYGIYIKNSSAGTVEILNNDLNITRLSYDGIGILIEETNGVELGNNRCVGGSYGISVFEAENVSIFKNNCSFNFKGIILQYVKNSFLEKNYCCNNTEGIKISRCFSITIAQNTCNLNAKYEIMSGDYLRNGIGIHVTSSSDYCLAIGNNCSGNSQSGIELSHSDYFIAFNNTLRSNKIGITIWGSTGFPFFDVQSEIAIVYNNLTNNEEYGIEIWGSRGCYIYKNIFIDNNIEGTSYGFSQARDLSKRGTKWFDEQSNIGNYWSDWNFKSNYRIDGNRIESWNYDPYPIANFSEMDIPPLPPFPNSLWFPDKGFYIVRFWFCVIGAVLSITLLIKSPKLLRKLKKND